MLTFIEVNRMAVEALRGIAERAPQIIPHLSESELQEIAKKRRGDEKLEILRKVYADRKVETWRWPEETTIENMYDLYKVKEEPKEDADAEIHPLNWIGLIALGTIMVFFIIRKFKQ